MNRAQATRPLPRHQWLAVAVAVAVVGGLIGLVAWNALVASAPLYSYGPPQEELGSRAYAPLLLAVALVGGFLIPTHAILVGVAVGLPGLLLSPWTAPAVTTMGSGSSSFRRLRASLRSWWWRRPLPAGSGRGCLGTRPVSHNCRYSGDRGSVAE